MFNPSRRLSTENAGYITGKMVNDLSPKRTMIVLVIVVGCFAVLWPKVFYPMVVGSANNRIKPSPIDRTQGCCDVISEKDLTTIKLMSEICSTIIQKVDDTPISNKELISKCQSVVLETCGIDISAVLQQQVRLGHTTKQILQEIRSLNGSLCLKYNFGVATWKLGVPHRVTVKVTPSYNIRQERPLHLRSEMIHPAFRERGRAIPQAESFPSTKPSPPSRIISKVVEGRPGPIPGMRPTIGGAGHVVPSSKHGGNSMGLIMPIYTIGIVVFFTYTVMKIIFKKQPEILYPPVDPDPHFKREVFEADRGHLDSRTTKDGVSSKLGWKERDAIVNAMSALLDEVDLELSSRRKTNEVDPQDVVANGSVLNQEDDQGSVQVLGMETTASCEGGQKWTSTDTPVIPQSHTLPTEPETPPQEIFLEGCLPPQSHLLVTDSAAEAQTTEYEDDPAVVLAGKMTLSVISLDSTENGTDESSGSKKHEDRSSSNVSDEFEKIDVAQLEEHIDYIPAVESVNIEYPDTKESIIHPQDILESFIEPQQEILVQENILSSSFERDIFDKESTPESTKELSFEENILDKLRQESITEPEQEKLEPTSFEPNILDTPEPTKELSLESTLQEDILKKELSTFFEQILNNQQESLTEPQQEILESSLQENILKKEPSTSLERNIFDEELSLEGDILDELTQKSTTKPTKEPTNQEDILATSLEQDILEDTKTKHSEGLSTFIEKESIVKESKEAQKSTTEPIKEVSIEQEILEPVIQEDILATSLEQDILEDTKNKLSEGLSTFIEKESIVKESKEAQKSTTEPTKEVSIEQEILEPTIQKDILSSSIEQDILEDTKNKLSEGLSTFIEKESIVKESKEALSVKQPEPIKLENLDIEKNLIEIEPIHPEGQSLVLQEPIVTEQKIKQLLLEPSERVEHIITESSDDDKEDLIVKELEPLEAMSNTDDTSNEKHPYGNPAFDETQTEDKCECTHKECVSDEELPKQEDPQIKSTIQDVVDECKCTEKECVEEEIKIDACQCAISEVICSVFPTCSSACPGNINPNNNQVTPVLDNIVEKIDEQKIEVTPKELQTPAKIVPSAQKNDLESKTAQPKPNTVNKQETVKKPQQTQHQSRKTSSTQKTRSPRTSQQMTKGIKPPKCMCECVCDCQCACVCNCEATVSAKQIKKPVRRTSVTKSAPKKTEPAASNKENKDSNKETASKQNKDTANKEIKETTNKNTANEEKNQAEDENSKIPDIGDVGVQNEDVCECTYKECVVDEELPNQENENPQNKSTIQELGDVGIQNEDVCECIEKECVVDEELPNQENENPQSKSTEQKDDVCECTEKECAAENITEDERQPEVTAKDLQMGPNLRKGDLSSKNTQPKQNTINKQGSGKKPQQNQSPRKNSADGEQKSKQSNNPRLSQQISRGITHTHPPSECEPTKVRNPSLTKSPARNTSLTKSPARNTSLTKSPARNTPSTKNAPKAGGGKASNKVTNNKNQTKDGASQEVGGVEPVEPQKEDECKCIEKECVSVEDLPNQAEDKNPQIEDIGDVTIQQDDTCECEILPNQVEDENPQIQDVGDVKIQKDDDICECTKKECVVDVCECGISDLICSVFPTCSSACPGNVNNGSKVPALGNIDEKIEDEPKLGNQKTKSNQPTQNKVKQDIKTTQQRQPRRNSVGQQKQPRRNSAGQQNTKQSNNRRTSTQSARHSHPLDECEPEISSKQIRKNSVRNTSLTKNVPKKGTQVSNKGTIDKKAKPVAKRMQNVTQTQTSQNAVGVMQTQFNQPVAAMQTQCNPVVSIGQTQCPAMSVRTQCNPVIAGTQTIPVQFATRVEQSEADTQTEVEDCSKISLSRKNVLEVTVDDLCSCSDTKVTKCDDGLHCGEIEQEMVEYASDEDEEVEEEEVEEEEEDDDDVDEESEEEEDDEEGEAIDDEEGEAIDDEIGAIDEEKATHV